VTTRYVSISSSHALPSDSTGAPRPVVNSKGRRRRPGTKTLAQVLRCEDDLFVDFIAKCLIWDPERRLKPQAAMRHPFLTSMRSSRGLKTIPSTPSKSLLSSSSASLSSSSRNTNKVAETPKKSQIGAPTPLAARGTRAPTATVPQTPVGSGTLHSLGPRYRTSVTSSHHSSRYAVSVAITVMS
jgi:dual specificity tyrosine-phosphorylation-regulated kinase 2/3/4